VPTAIERLVSLEPYAQSGCASSFRFPKHLPRVNVTAILAGEVWRDTRRAVFGTLASFSIPEQHRHSTTL